ncbi:MAG: NAD(P)H-hydrate dehydratase [Proteobacteria bacterium]|nr:NAD(P)H-hydrate dehydratase [Pseudomonadota bacterium]
MRLVDSQQMQEMDRHTIEEIGVPGIVLMENAARSWVEAAVPYMDKDSVIYVFCGSGNNGGDGYAIARNLANRGYDCTVIAVKPPKSEDCVKNASAWIHFGMTIAWDKFLETDFANTDRDIIVDAVLGTGIESDLKGPLVDAINIIDKFKGFKIAVDVPSGISASTGDILGIAIRNDVTITFQKEKVGHHLYPGKQYSGEIISQPISILERYNKQDREYRLITNKHAKTLLPVRRPDSYKNNYGHLITWCGNPGTLGASFLASYAAIKTGTGLTTAALPKEAGNSFLIKAPELMSCAQESLTVEYLEQYDAIALGCGLGREKSKWQNILAVIKTLEKPMVMDADAFYGITDWSSLDLSRTVLTPHPGEFSQLTGFPKPKSNKERLQQGLNFISKHNTTLVLKGAPTIIFSEQGAVYINSTGNSGMSTAGSGDVLTGIIGGFLAQGLSPLDAAVLGVWLHGKSGDLYAEDNCEESLTAMSLIEKLNPAISFLKSCC